MPASFCPPRMRFDQRAVVCVNYASNHPVLATKFLPVENSKLVDGFNDSLRRKQVRLDSITLFHVLIAELTSQL